ncbi:retrotransposon protein, putative, ty1-copia subclass [Tanacetum coccineum]
MGYAPVQAPPFAPKPKNPPTPKKDNHAKDAICYQCGEVGHWRRNCPIYLAELLKKKKLSQGASTSGIFTIELYSFPSTFWVYDTGCGTHICITTQGLRGSRKLKPGALSLYVGDGHRATVEAIVEFHLCLPSGLVLILHNFHYAPFITRGIISVSRLYKDGFVNRFENDNTISVSRNNLVCFCAIPRDDIYEIDLSSFNTNDCSMYAVSNKRAKLNLDSSLLWHCRLGHISKKRIEKLQHDGLLNSTDIKSFKKCVSCMSGKMTRKLYSHQVKKAKDLLGLIYTDDYDLESAARILNMVPTKKVDKTAYEVWHGQAPKLSYLRAWGCEALVKRDTLTKPDKLEPRSIKCIFVGYLKETMGYSFYYPPENKIFIARNAEFFENSLIIQEASGSLEDLEIIQEEDTHPYIDTSLHHEEDD